MKAPVVVMPQSKKNTSSSILKSSLITVPLYMAMAYVGVAATQENDRNFCLPL